MSGRVISSGYIPPVSSKRARRNRVSDLKNEHVNCLVHAHVTEVTHIPNLSAMPGRYQTGSTAALEANTSIPGSASLSVPSGLSRGRLFNMTLPSLTRVPFLALSSSSESLIWALVTAILGRTSNPNSSISFLKTWGTRCPHGSNDTILEISNHALFGGISTGGSVNE